MNRRDLYHDLTDAIEQALWETAVIDPADGTLATFPNGDSAAQWVTPEKVIAAVAGRVTAVFKIHGQL